MTPNQATLDGERQTTFGNMVPEEPIVDGVPQVLVSSSTQARTSRHKQDPHNEGKPKCGRTLRAEHTYWTFKPKTAMERATDRCPVCYPEVSLED